MPTIPHNLQTKFLHEAKDSQEGVRLEQFKLISRAEKAKLTIVAGKRKA